jgi:tetrahydromethanopterin S-methyltransferase subunit B
MEVLPLVQVVPEFTLALDPVSGVLGAALGGDIIILSMDEINEQIDSLEAAADDLMNSLDPTTTSDGSFAGREGAYLTAGMLTNVVYGFIVGLVLLVALLL